MGNRTVWLALAVGALGGCGDPLSEGAEGEHYLVVDRDAFEARERAASVSPARVDNGDGTWSYALPAGFDPEVRVRGRILTWRYDGQERYRHEPRRSSGPKYFFEDGDPPTDPLERLLRTTRSDRFGRRWVVEAVDEAAWHEAIEDDGGEHALAGEARRAGGSDVATPVRVREPEPAIGALVEWLPTSWDHLDCTTGSFGPGKEVHLWEGEDRISVTSGWDDHEKAVVSVSGCTGVLVRNNRILTAAHCVSDDDNEPVANSSITVCQYDRTNCVNPTDIELAADYRGGSSTGGGTDFDDDWAILDIEPWTTRITTMSLSSVSDTVYEDLTRVHNIAFPGWAQSCTWRNGTRMYRTEEFEPIASISGSNVRFKIDGSGGHSGSPFFYCPTDDDSVCLSTEAAFVYGVFAGWNSLTDRFAGPKVTAFRDEALGIIND